jgi:hypothetical protein
MAQNSNSQIIESASSGKTETLTSNGNPNTDTGAAARMRPIKKISDQRNKRRKKAKQ